MVRVPERQGALVPARHYAICQVSPPAMLHDASRHPGFRSEIRLSTRSRCRDIATVSLRNEGDDGANLPCSQRPSYAILRRLDVRYDVYGCVSGCGILRGRG